MFESRFLAFWVHFYERLIWLGNNLQSLFLLYFRCAWGYQFFLSGMHHLTNVAPAIDFFTRIGIPHADVYAPVVSRLEMGCGLLLILGLASRVASLPLIATMVVSIQAIQNPSAPHSQLLFESNFLTNLSPSPFLFTALLVLIFGPGRISVDAVIKRRIEASRD
jgi:putative oxidoreductase